MENREPGMENSEPANQAPTGARVLNSEFPVLHSEFPVLHFLHPRHPPPSPSARTGHADFGQNMRAEKDGRRSAQTADQAADFDDLAWVETHRRFVENEHFRFMQQRLR